MRNATGVPYLHGDHPSTREIRWLRTGLGSASLATNASGGVHSQARYKPFGETRWEGPAANALPTDLQFTGQRKEAGIGLYDYGARFYDPLIGRFVSADSIVPNPDNPQSLNRYSYVKNRPLNYIDPTGHCDASTFGFTAGGCEGGGMAPPEKAEVQQALDVVGVIDPTGIADGLNAAIYFQDGDYLNAGISAASLLPYGDLAKGARVAVRSVKGTIELSEAASKTIAEFGIKAFKDFDRPLSEAGNAAHHLVEKRFWRQLGFATETEGINNILAIEIGGKQHGPLKDLETITGELRKRISYGQGTEKAELQDIWNAHRDVYQKFGHNDWAELIWETYFKDKNITK